MCTFEAREEMTGGCVHCLAPISRPFWPSSGRSGASRRLSKGPFPPGIRVVRGSAGRPLSWGNRQESHEAPFQPICHRTPASLPPGPPPRTHKADMKTADALRGLMGDWPAWCASSPRRWARTPGAPAEAPGPLPEVGPGRLRRLQDRGAAADSGDPALRREATGEGADPPLRRPAGDSRRSLRRPANRAGHRQGGARHTQESSRGGDAVPSTGSEAGESRHRVARQDNLLVFTGKSI